MPTEIAKSLRPIGDESQNTSSVLEQLLDSFKSCEEYRHAYVEEKVRTSVAAQIKAIREQRQLTQPEFADRLGKSQSWVSRLEDPNQPVPTVPSLLTVAEAFDVDLEIRFGRFSDLLRRLDAMTPESFEVPSFKEELASGAFEGERKPSSIVFNYLGTPSLSFAEGEGNREQQRIDAKSASLLVNCFRSWLLRTAGLREAAEARGAQRTVDEDAASLQTMHGTPFMNPVHEASKQVVEAA